MSLSLVTSARETLYHGTTTKLARQVLSEGFVPDPRRRVWDQEAKKLASYSGTYLTRDLRIAWEAAEQAANKFGGERCIIEAQVETRTGLMDEDELPDLYYSVVWVTGGRTKAAGKRRREIARHWIETFAKSFFDEMDVRFAASPLLLQHLQEPVEAWVDAWADASTSGIQLDPEEDNFETTPELQAAKGQVIRAVGNVAKLQQGRNLRVLTPIRFKGANKILAGVVSPWPGHPILKQLQRNTALCVVFGKPSAKFRADAAKLWGRSATFLRCGADMLKAHVYAKQDVDPDQYRKERGRCPRGYSFDGERCVKKGSGKPKDGPSRDAEPSPRGKGRTKPPKAPKSKSPKSKGKPKGKPKPVKPQGPVEKVTKKNPYGLAQSVRSAKTLADIGGHGALKKILGHMAPSKMPPPDVDPATIELNLGGDNDSKALMTWRDPKGRKQAAYTEKLLSRNAAKKWERVKKLDAKADKAIAKFGKMMGDTKASEKQRDAAAIMNIIGQTGLRPGSASGLKDTGNRGISTLKADNVKIDGDTVRLDFIGKSGKRNVTEVKDPALAKYLKERLKDKGGDDPLFSAKSGDLPKAMKAAGVGGFKPKDFRTRMAGKISASALSAVDDPPPLPKSEKKAKALIAKRVKEISTVVADQLNNTPAMAKKAYIDPAVFRAWAKAIGAEQYLVAAATKPTADDLWKSALEETLPGADEAVEIDPELEDDEQLDSVPEPVIDAENASTARFERVIAGLVAGNHRDLAGLVCAVVLD